MSLFSQLLKECEVKKLEEILTPLLVNRDTKDIVRGEFRTYVRGVTTERFNNTDICRMINHPSKVKYERQVLFYDYVLEQLAPAIVGGRFRGPFSKDVANKLKSLVDEARSRGPKPWDIHGLHKFLEPISKPYINQFFGYRMSANAGNVIRFLFDIIPVPDNPEVVTYENDYRSGETKLKIRGTGRLIQGCLYLVGHATDVLGRASWGIRTMALKKIGTSDHLTGIVLTEDQGLPIAARVLLVPTAMHPLHERSKGRASKSDIDKYVMEGMLDRKVSDAIDEMNVHALDDLKTSHLTSPEEVLAAYIDNTSPTVLKAGNALSYDIARLSKVMNTLRSRVQVSNIKERGRVVTENMTAAIEKFGLNLEAGVRKEAESTSLPARRS